MRELAYINGEFVDADRARIPVTDWGFLQGVTLAEQLRTFRGQPFLIEEHLNRLQAGVELLGLASVRVNELSEIVERIARHNWPIARSCSVSELGITVFVTPGTYPSYRPDEVPGEEQAPTVCVHSYPLPTHRWQPAYHDGVSLVSVSIEQVPSSCWPVELKCRSRMHYFLANREAKRRKPDSEALVSNRDGFVSETPTANLAAYFSDGRILTPPITHALNGVSLAFLERLAATLRIDFERVPLTTDILRTADELWLTSTPYCVLPVRQLDDVLFDAPGIRFQEIIKLWSERVGVDLIQRDGNP